MRLKIPSNKFKICHKMTIQLSTLERMNQAYKWLNRVQSAVIIIALILAAWKILRIQPF